VIDHHARLSKERARHGGTGERKKTCSSIKRGRGVTWESGQGTGGVRVKRNKKRQALKKESLSGAPEARPNYQKGGLKERRKAHTKRISGVVLGRQTKSEKAARETEEEWQRPGVLRHREMEGGRDLGPSQSKIWKPLFSGNKKKVIT